MQENNWIYYFCLIDSCLNNTINFIASKWALVLCVILALAIFFYMPDLEENSLNYITRFTSIISTIFSAIIIGYLTGLSIQIRREKLQREITILNLSQKVHNYRRILRVIYDRDNFWKDGLKLHMDQKYVNLSYFRVKKARNVYNILFPDVKEFFDDDSFQGLKKFYLEIKTLVSKSYRDPILYSDYADDRRYKKDIIRKWHTYNCGLGIYHIFDLEYPNYKNDFNFNAFTASDNEYAKRIARMIDNDRFYNFSLAPSDIVELANYFTEFVFEKLLRYQEAQSRKLPRIIKELYLLLALLVISGVILPIGFILFGISEIIILYSSSFTLLLALYILLVFGNYLKRVMDID